jgi:hypothetical protein
MAALFASPDLAVDALYYRPGEAVGTACRVILREERQEFGPAVAQAVGTLTTARVRAADLPGGRPAPRARIGVGGTVYEVQQSPEQAASGVWRLGLVELRP